MFRGRKTPCKTNSFRACRFLIKNAQMSLMFHIICNNIQKDLQLKIKLLEVLKNKNSSIVVVGRYMV